MSVSEFRFGLIQSALNNECASNTQKADFIQALAKRGFNSLEQYKAHVIETARNIKSGTETERWLIANNVIEDNSYSNDVVHPQRYRVVLEITDLGDDLFDVSDIESTLVSYQDGVDSVEVMSCEQI